MSTSTIEIEGADIRDYDSFVDAVGSHFSPPVEGHAIQSEYILSDRLVGGYGIEPPIKLTWRNSSESQAILNAEKLIEYRKRSLSREEYFDEDGREFLVSSLNSEQTLFDYLVGFLQSKVDELILD